jgi:sulfur carrier protein ThiS
MGKLKIIVHLHTVLQIQTTSGPVSKLTVELPSGSRLKDLITHLAITLPLEALMLAVNYRVADENLELQDGDQVNIMPAISGGS